MSGNLFAFLAGAAWLAVFTAGLFAFSNWGKGGIVDGEMNETGHAMIR